MLLLADAYMAKGDDADAQVILETLIDNKPKQEYIDEAKKRLDIIKAKEAEKVEKEKLNQNMDMKVRFNESEKDSSIMQEIKFEAETPAVPSNTINIQQPK